MLCQHHFDNISQGPRNPYGRESKFRATFKSGTERDWFSIQLLMTWSSWCHQFHLPKYKLTPSCTFSLALVTSQFKIIGWRHFNSIYLHLYFQQISDVTPLTSVTGGGRAGFLRRAISLQTHVQHPTFPELPQPLHFLSKIYFCSAHIALVNCWKAVTNQLQMQINET